MLHNMALDDDPPQTAIIAVHATASCSNYGHSNSQAMITEAFPSKLVPMTYVFHNVCFYQEDE